MPCWHTVYVQYTVDAKENKWHPKLLLDAQITSQELLKFGHVGPNGIQ